MFDSDSDSSQNLNDSGIDSDSGIGIVHHWWQCQLLPYCHIDKIYSLLQIRKSDTVISLFQGTPTVYQPQK